MKTMHLNRLLSLVLCLCMMVGMIPVTAHAAPADETIHMTVTKYGEEGEITQFENTDSIVVSMTLTEVQDGNVGSDLYFKTSDGEYKLLSVLNSNHDLSAHTKTFTLVGGVCYEGSGHDLIMVSPGEYHFALKRKSPDQTYIDSDTEYTVTGDESTPGVQDQPLDMTVTRGGDTVTEFSNTDKITITATLPGAVVDFVGSLHFVSTDGNKMVEMYPPEGNVTVSGNTVTFTLDGLYSYDYRAQIEQGDGKGDPLAPGTYKIKFWNGIASYISTGTFTVTAGEAQPQEIRDADVVFTTTTKGSEETILSGRDYTLYLYTEQIVADNETATATIHYTGGTETVTLTKDGRRSLSYTDALPSTITGTIEKVDFKFGDLEISKEVNKKVTTTFVVKFTGKTTGEGDSRLISKYLEVYKDSELKESIYLGYYDDLASRSTYVVLDAGSQLSEYTFKVVGEIGGREVVYGEGNGSDVADDALTINLSANNPKYVYLTVYYQDEDTYVGLQDYQVTIKWYDQENGGKVIATGDSYYMFPGEEAFVEVESIRYISEVRTKVTAANSGESVEIRVQNQPEYEVSGKVTVGSQPVAGARVTVTNMDRGYAYTHTATTDADGTYSIKTPLLEGATVIAGRDDLVPNEATTLTAKTDNKNTNITLSYRKGVITLTDSSYYDFTITDESGNPVGYTLYGQGKKIILTDNKDESAKYKLRFNTRDNVSYADVNVSLNKGLATVGTLNWVDRGRASFTLINPSTRFSYAIWYDEAGNYLDVDYVYAPSGLSSTPYESFYLDKGSYTCLFVPYDVYRKVVAENITLEEAKEVLDGLGSNMYTEVSVEIRDGETSKHNAILPTGSVDSKLDTQASGLTISTDGGVITARITATPKNISEASDTIYVELSTNQRSSGEDTAFQIIPGSLYINGKRPADDDVVIRPDTQDHVTDFNGQYKVTVNNVSKYGGWPVTLQWQSNRTNLTEVNAGVLVSVDGDTRNLDFAGSVFLYEPQVDLNVPSAVGEETFHVYGSAPANSDLTFFMDGTEAGQVKASDLGYFNVELSLDNPIGPEVHTVSAVAEKDGQTVSSDVMYVYYNASMPVLAKIELTDYQHYWKNMWSVATGVPTNASYYYYLPQTPMQYRLTFTTGGQPSKEGDLETVRVCLPRTDDVVELEATYKGNGQWVTEPYRCGNNPPVDAWVEYNPAISGAQMTEKEYGEFKLQLEEDMNFKVDSEKQAEVNSELAKVGLTGPVWEDGKLTSAKLTFMNNGVERHFKVTHTYEEGASKPSFPTNPSASEMENQVKQGFTFTGHGSTSQYSRMGMVNGVFTVETVDRYQFGTGSFWSHETMTINKYVQEQYDEGTKILSTTTYENLDNMSEPVPDPDNDYPDEYTVDGVTRYGYHSSRDNLYKCDQVYAVWTTVINEMSKAENKLSEDNTNIVAYSGTLASGRASGDGSYTPPAYVNSEAAIYQQLRQTLKDNGVENGPGNKLWEKAVANDPNMRGQYSGFYGHLGHKLDELWIQALWDRIENLFQSSAGGAAKELGKMVAKDLYNNRMNRTKLKLDFASLPEETQQVIAITHGLLVELGDDADWSNYTDNDEYPVPERFKPGGSKKKDRYKKEKISKNYSFQEFTIYHKIPNKPKPVIDPSGFVFEGVESNRLPGASATVYEVNKDTGDRTMWDATAAGQSNPLTTDENGFYQWYVPEGGWSVTVTMAGYEDYTTGATDGVGAQQAGSSETYYMPVPPAQMDVNIGMTSKASPEVESMAAAPDGVYIAFTQYMKVDSLKDEVFTMKVDGEDIEFKIDCVKELDPKGVELTRSIILRPVSGKLNLGDSVMANVADSAQNYAGNKLRSSQIMTIKVEKAPQAEMPIATPASGSKVDVNSAVELSCEDGGRIYYTIDGKDPDMNSKLYTGPVLITADTTIKAIVVKAGMENSEVAVFTYTVGASNDTPPTPPANNNGGGGFVAPSVTVKTESTANGSFTVSNKSAKTGDTVTVTPKADKGYVVDTVTVTDKNGKAVEVKVNEDGTYSFVMPATSAQPVTIKVTFKVEKCDGGKNCPSRKFTDVDQTAWYHEGVDYAIKNGLMVGTGETAFAPNATTTRAMVVTILYRLEGEPTVTKNIPFEDVSTGKWYSDAINWAATNQIVDGYGNGKFGPDDTITREQMAAILYRYASYKGYDVTGLANLTGFTDAGKVSTWATTAVRWAVDAGLIKGTGTTTLSPTSDSTRAQVATVLMRFCEDVAK